MKATTKWYNDPQMVGSLLLFLPPAGIYGVYKSETIKPKWKKVTFRTLAFSVLLLALVYFL